MSKNTRSPIRRHLLSSTSLAYAVNRSSPDNREELDVWLTQLGEGELDAGAAALEGFVGGLAASSNEGLSRDVKVCFDFDKVDEPVCSLLNLDEYPRSTMTVALSTEVPTLFLQGALDTQTPIALSDGLRSQFKNLSERVFDRCIGHFSYLDGGACSDEVVAAFLAGEALPICQSAACDALTLATP